MQQQVRDDRALLAAQGYLHVDDSGLRQTDLDDVAELLDPLFDRLHELPDGRGHDLVPGSGAARVPEVLYPSRLEPRLLGTPVFAFWSEVARSLLGPRAHLAFDHAIFKPAGPSAPTPWHQDSGYAGPDATGIAIWIPLQDVGLDDGCMRYGPGSHLLGPLPHAERRSSAGAPVRSLSWDDHDTVAVPVDAGGAAIHSVHTVHGTGPNLGRTTRRVWILNAAVARPLAHTIGSTKRALGRNSYVPLQREARFPLP